jgi:hypothetical protein
MTLILSVLAPDWVMQASDRRFTTKNADSSPEFIDRANKAVFVAERFSFAFTGRVDVDSKTADEWLQLSLSRLFLAGMCAEEAFVEVAALLDGKISTLPSDDQNRALTMVGVGWTDDSFAVRQPLLVRVSNVHDETGISLPAPSETFSISTEFLGTSTALLGVDGLGLDEEKVAALEAEVEGFVVAGEPEEVVARALVQTIRERAQESPGVGKGVMLNGLPRAPGPPDGEIRIIGAWPTNSVRTFACLNEGDESAVMHAPLIVASDGGAMSSFHASGGQGFPNMNAPLGSFGPTSGLGYGDPANPKPLPRAAIGQSVRALPKFGRNDPCWCESGRKFKKCHGA